MSRSGYSDDIEHWDLIRWRGAVASALRGRRGQGFLKEMLAALDAMPEQRLIAGDLARDGAVCAIGAVGKARGIDMDALDPLDADSVANTFCIARAMASEIVFENDENGLRLETPEARFARMRSWIAAKINPPQPPAP